MEFKVGDQVKVVKKVDSEEGWVYRWISPEMDLFIGNEYIIDSIEGSGGIVLRSDIDVAYFPASALELVSVI